MFTPSSVQLLMENLTVMTYSATLEGAFFVVWCHCIACSHPIKHQQSQDQLGFHASRVEKWHRNQSISTGILPGPPMLREWGECSSVEVEVYDHWKDTGEQTKGAGRERKKIISLKSLDWLMRKIDRAIYCKINQGCSVHRSRSQTTFSVWYLSSRHR